MANDETSSDLHIFFGKISFAHFGGGLFIIGLYTFVLIFSLDIKFWVKRMVFVLFICLFA